MDETIILSLQGQTTATEEAQLRAWRQASQQNERIYAETANAWRLAGLIVPASVPGLRRPAESVTLRSRLHSLLAARWLTAGALTAAALLAGFGVDRLWERSNQAPPFSVQEFSTGPGEMVTTRLSDGTVVRLAPQSRLRVSGDGEREVWLDGRAFFAVARDEKRQFTVRTRAGEAIVLGTRFDVRVDGDGMQVFVVEGKVVHQAGGQEVQVGAMELSRAAEGGAPVREPVADAEPLLSWLGEFLVFQSTPIREVAAELERRFHVRVRVADGDLAERKVTGWFTNESLEQVVLIVCRAADVRCVVRDNAVSIEP